MSWERDAGLPQAVLGLSDSYGAKIGARTAATEHKVPVGVAGGADEGGLAIAVHAQKTMRAAGGQHGVYGDLGATVGAVLESDGHAQAAGHLPVDLALGGAGADGTPGYQASQILRDNRVEELGAGVHPHLADLEKERAGGAKASLDVEAVIEVRVINKALPANCGTGLFEVDPHHDEKAVADFFGQFLEAARVIQGRFLAVDGAGSDHKEQPGILTIENPSHLSPALQDSPFHGGSDGEGVYEISRCGEGLHRLNVYISGCRRLHGVPSE